MLATQPRGTVTRAEANFHGALRDDELELAGCVRSSCRAGRRGPDLRWPRASLLWPLKPPPNPSWPLPPVAILHAAPVQGSRALPQRLAQPPRHHRRPLSAPKDQIAPRTSSRSIQKVRYVNHTLSRVHNLSMNCIARGSFEAATCPTAPAPAAQPRSAPGSPRAP
jgi:hypothetical protein